MSVDAALKAAHQYINSDDIDIAGKFKEAVYIDGQLAADAFYMTPSDFGPDDPFPPLKLPFNSCVIAYTMEKQVVHGELQYAIIPATYVSVISSSVSPVDKRYTRLFFQNFQYIGYTNPDAPYGLVNWGGVIEDIDENGERIRDAKNIYLVPDKLRKIFNSFENTNGEDINTVVNSVSAPAAYVIAVMNTSNVVLNDKPFTRQQRRSHGFNMTIKRLTVMGSKKSRRQTSIVNEEITPNHPGVARHICRGHFRDYRQGAGLFGRFHGIYWTPPIWKGSFTRGFVTKSYKVAVPKNNP